MPDMPPEALAALVWLIVTDVALASAFAAAYAARIVRSWMRRDQ